MKLIVAISGASGAIYSKAMLDILKGIPDIDLSVIASNTACSIWRDELGSSLCDEYSGAFEFLDNSSYYALPASGSHVADGMIVIPCSMGELGRIASGVSVDLIGRVADVQLKERKPLVLVTREAPLSLIHIRNMERVTEAGGVIFPASPPLYNSPLSVEEMAYKFSLRVLDFLGIRLVDDTFRWMKNC